MGQGLSNGATVMGSDFGYERKLKQEECSETGTEVPMDEPLSFIIRRKKDNVIYSYDLTVLKKLVDDGKVDLQTIPLLDLEPAADKERWIVMDNIDPYSEDIMRVSVNQVIANPDLAPNRYRLIKGIKESAMEQPIYLTLDEDQEYDVLDGLHRLAKAKIDGKESISAYVFTPEQLQMAQVEQ